MDINLSEIDNSLLAEVIGTLDGLGIQVDAIEATPIDDESFEEMLAGITREDILEVDLNNAE